MLRGMPPFVLPFAGLDRRTVWLRVTLLGAVFLGLIASAPVWFNTRDFPLLPVASWFPLLSPPWDGVLFAGMLAALAAACWRYRAAVAVFLLASLLAFCQDQNRGQPWLYMYWVTLLLTLFPGTAAACRVAMSAVYLWSGIQKINPRYFDVVPGWFSAPAAEWPVPAFMVELVRWAVAAAPFIEIAIGLAVWLPAARRPALVTAVALHLTAVLLLGPLGHNYNWVVWPWNLAMISLLWASFGRGEFWEKRVGGIRPPAAMPPPPAIRRGFMPEAAWPAAAPDLSFAETVAQLRRSKPSLAVVTLYSLLPVLSFAGKWDSDFSFSLYSENQAVANIFVTRSFADRLPARLRAYVQPFPREYDPAHQGPYLFAYQVWCYEALRVPPFPEPRHFRSLYRFLRAYASAPEELRMIVGQRGGPVLFYEGDRVEVLERE